MSHIISDGLSWNKPDGTNLFNNISFTCGTEISGLVGNNGIGKSVLARIICKEIIPSTGSISTIGNITYIPQDLTIYNNKNLLALFGIEAKYKALNQILSGNYSERDLLILNDEWDLEEKLNTQLAIFNLQNISFDRQFESFSGGEKVKAVLCSIFFHNPDFIILDEPTNHLDLKTRKFVYDFVENSKIGMLIISHDRTLLNLTSRILELSANGISTFGGNFDSYYNWKKHLDSIHLHNFEKATAELRKVKYNTKKELAKQNARTQSAESKSLNGGIPKIILNKRINDGENNLAKTKLILDQKIETVEKNFLEAKRKYKNITSLKIDYEIADIPNGKRIIQFKDVNFSFSEIPLWKTPLSFILTGNEKLHIKGDNGTGKSTILKLIKNELKPTTGTIYIGVSNIGTLDQEMSMLNFNETVYNNIKHFDSNHLTEGELRIRLSRYQFFNYDVFKKVKDLSGGEKIKLGFACLFSNTNSPELLLLDEPTNNLDLNSVKQLKDLLINFKGALIVISHDIDFVKDLNVDSTIDLSENKSIEFSCC